MSSSSDTQHESPGQIPTYRLHRRAMLRLMGLGGATLLAACSSQSSTNKNETPTTGSSSSGGTTATSATSASPAATTGGTAGTPAAAATTTATTAAKKGGTVAIAVDQEPPTLDPHASPSAITFTMTSSASESLLYLNDKRELVPWLAASYEAAADGKSVTFKLNTDVTFQDGTPFNATAVKWNLDRIVDPNFKAGAALSSLSGYTGTDVVDDATAKVNFEAPFAPFVSYAASPFLVFLSPDGTQKQGDQVATAPVTSGPYQFTEYVAKDHATMKRWDDYKRKLPWADHDGPGFLDSITWKFVPEAGTRSATVETGDAQVATPITSQDIDRFNGSKDVKVQSAPWVGVPLVMLLNTQKAPTDDVKVRQAINYAIDKEGMINTLFKGLGEVGYGYLAQALLPVPELKSTYPFDQGKAKQILDDAGWTAGSGGTRAKNGEQLKIILNTIDYGGGADPTSEFIQGQLQQVGVAVEIKAQARPPFYEDNYNGATHASTISLRIGEYDALFSLFNSKYIGANFNWSRLNDPDIDQMLENGREEIDADKRKQIYVDLEKKLMDIAPGVPLIDQYSVWALRSNVNGLKFNGFTYPIVSDMSLS
jgi:peptide/nickel transport system substrate-binding protein